MINKNHGVRLGKRPTDWGQVGVATKIPYEVVLDNGDYTPYEPTPENQKGTLETMTCVTQSMQNIIKTLIIRDTALKRIPADFLAWLNEKGYIDQSGKPQFSARFNAIRNGTSKQGNWLYIVADDVTNPTTSIRQPSGLIPESMLPDNVNLTWDEYYNPAVITPEMIAMGKEFLTWVKINYEWVEPTIPELTKHLKQSPLQIVILGGSHAVVEIKQTSDIYRIWDSYKPYQVDLKNTIMPLSPLKYVLTYLTNPLTQKPMLKTYQQKGDNRVYAEIDGNYYWITSDRMYAAGLGKIFDPFVIVPTIDPTKVIGTFNKEY